MPEPQFGRSQAAAAQPRIVERRVGGGWARRLAMATLPPALALLAQPAPVAIRPGPQLAVFESGVDGSKQPYALYVPKPLGRRYPLVICLHEEDSNHRLGLRRVFGAPSRLGEPDTEDMRYFPPVRDVDFIVACPLARGTMGYQGIPERDVYDVLADVERRLPVDEDRVYLTGVSMGGGGALRLALTRPDVWAAVAVVSPTPVPGLEELAPNALHVPIRLFQGDQDSVVPVESSRAWQRRFLDAGVPAEYVEYPGVRHNAWDPAYRNGAIFDWFQKFRRERFPERVHLVTRSYRYATAYWVRVDGLTPGTLASIDAAFGGGGALQIATQNVDAFTVTLGDVPATAITVTIDGIPIVARASASMSFVRTAARWRLGYYTAPAKRPGAEGPIAEAVAGRQIYVYGSGGARTADELDARRKIAETAAHWSTARARLSLALPVEVDTAVTAAEMAGCDLILFGTAETNSVIAGLGARLPLALSPAAADYGLLFIAPVGRHYVLVSSGLPWWTGADEANRGGDRLAPEQYRLLSTFGDFILFKGSLANVVTEGRFDGNWKTPADASAKMLATGTVSIR